MYFDLPLKELQTYLPAREEPADFDAFWARTLAETRRHPLAARFEPHECGLRRLDVFDVTFNGYAGQPVKGWLLKPKGEAGPLPCVVEFIGYGGGRSLAVDWTLWPSVGYATLVMDTRGQGTTWSTGDTPDPELEGGNPQLPGFMTRGILSPETYYYRRVFSDAVRAVEAARAAPGVDGARVALSGGSQGGGITLAASALADSPAAIMPDVPFLCHYRRAVAVTDGFPYAEIQQYCQRHRDKIETAFTTLSYFDGLNFAARAKAPALFSVGLMDEICPPSTVFAAYNHYAGPKRICVWPYNHHEGGESFQTVEKIKFLSELGWENLNH